jgi:hypothetical protein
MTSPISKGGLPLSSIFAAYVSGAKAAATGILENGVDLCNKYAPYVSGTKAAATGIFKNGVDLCNILAKLVTASPLGFDGQNYSSSGGRGSHTVTLTMNTDGTWTISAPTSGSPLSGSWFIFGGALSDYTVRFTMTGFASGPDPDGGSNSFTNGATTAVSLTTARSCSCSSTATTIGTDASNGGAVLVELFKSGTLVSSSNCGFNTDAAGT